MSIFRIRFKVAGGHVHCRLFSARSKNTTFAKCGDFTVSKGEEFQDLVRSFYKVEFINDDESEGILEAMRP